MSGESPVWIKLILQYGRNYSRDSKSENFFQQIWNRSNVFDALFRPLGCKSCDALNFFPNKLWLFLFDVKCCMKSSFLFYYWITIWCFHHISLHLLLPCWYIHLYKSIWCRKKSIYSYLCICASTGCDRKWTSGVNFTNQWLGYRNQNLKHLTTVKKIHSCKMI